MFSTPLQRQLKTALPIIGGTMMDLSTPPFVAAICNGGALGIIASAMYKDYDRFRDALRQLKDLTDRPFGVNLNLFPSMAQLDNLRFLEIAAEEGVRIIETSAFAPPEDLAAAVKARGLLWIHKCVGVRYARKAERLGADAVTVVGFENGGATGNLNVTTLVLVPATVDAVKIPVAGGGGVVDGRTLVAVLALGAQAAIVGTRLLLSEECPMHRDLKQALLRATELDTDVIMRSVGFAHRVWLNEASRKAAEVEARGGGIGELYPYVSGDAARRMYATGDLVAGSIACSQAVGLVHEIKPVAEILAEMMEQARELVARLGQAAMLSGQPTPNGGRR